MLPNNSFCTVDFKVLLDLYITLGCALPTMLQSVDNLGAIARGSNVVVQGAGPVGLAAIMLANLAGPTSIVSIEGNKSRLKRALDFSASIPVDFRREKFKTKELRAAYITEAVGAPVSILASNIAAMLPLLRKVLTYSAEVDSTCLLEHGSERVVSRFHHFRLFRKR